MSDFARKLVGIEKLNATGERWTGSGETIGVIDSGIDRAHPDFGQRIKHIEPGIAGGCKDDIFGHGTHVAGTAAGAGTASNNKVRGMAPEADLVIIGITDDSGRLCLPLDLGDLLRQAADKGAKIINLSWDTPLASIYDNGSMAVDRFVREHPDVLVVVAAGNEGRAPNGHPFLFSVGTPATAKNALTVGACASSRRGFTETWGAYDTARFPQAPTSKRRIAGNPSHVAAFSSRGPTDFQSIKPDLVAPGTAILAPRASQASARRFWREWPEYNGRYALMNGTSMAAPVVSGAAAVVRQLVQKEYGIEPSAAMLKSILVAGTRPLPWGRPKEKEKDFGYPDFDQGFGRLDLAQVLPGEHAPARRKLWLEDIPSDDVRALESRSPLGERHKASRRYRLVIADGDQQPLRAVLAWSDYQEATVQNCLSIELQGPGGMRLRGNAGHRWQALDDPAIDPRFLAASVDRRNNIQAIGIEKAVPGNYTLTIFASNTLFPPQGYGLCICAALASDPEDY